MVKVFTYADVYEDEKLAEVISALPKLEPSEIIEEPCSCWEQFGSPMCNDGGYYHTIIKVYEITPDLFLTVWGDTREAFGVEFKYVVVWAEEPVGVVVAKEQDGVDILSREEVERLVMDYSRDGYRIYAVE